MTEKLNLSNFTNMRFFDRRNIVTYVPNETIFSQGQDSEGMMYAILEGTIEISINEVLINTIGAGETLGELGLLDNQPRSATAIARTECKLIPINEKQFSYLVQKDPSFSLQVMRIISRRLRRFENPPDSLVPSQQDLISSLKTFNFEVITVNDVGQEIERETKKAKFVSVDLGKGVVLEMVSIPEGTFMRGSPESEEGHKDSESLDSRPVTVLSFYMGKYPITQAQWITVMGYNPSYFQEEKQPVELVSWHDCQQFCEKLSQRTGKNFSLPSEAQWEYACRAGTTTPFHFGATITTELANFDGTYSYGFTSKGKLRDETTPIDSFPPNAFGLYDMHGNVWEWCDDRWHDNYQGAPSDGSAWIDEENTDFVFSNTRCIRGGAFTNNPLLIRSASRDWAWEDYRLSSIGFRVVCKLL